MDKKIVKEDTRTEINFVKEKEYYTENVCSFYFSSMILQELNQRADRVARGNKKFVRNFVESLLRKRLLGRLRRK